MSDIELPDFGDLDRGVFLKKKKMLDSHSNSDSGNNSISTNASGKWYTQCSQEFRAEHEPFWHFS